jgi:hypothetical protein
MAGGVLDLPPQLLIGRDFGARRRRNLKIYSYALRIRNSAGFMMRKLSVTASQ